MIKSFVKGALHTIKEKATDLPDYPQARVQHNRPYLNEIARGHWRKLKPVQTIDKTQLSYFNWNDNNSSYEMSMYDRTDLFNSIRSGTQLRHVETKVYTYTFAKEWKLKMIADQRKRLFNDVLTFDRKQRLRHATPNKPFYMRYLDDITNHNWKQLRHVETMDKTQLKFMGWENYHMKRVDRTPLWKSIAGPEQITLRKVQDVKDRSKPYVEKDYTWARCVNARRRMLDDIVEFAKNPKFNNQRGMMQKEKGMNMMDKNNNDNNMPFMMSRNVEALQ